MTLALAIDLALRVVFAIVLGAAIGLERQWHLRTAGIRTNALVSVGAALFVILGAVGFGDGPEVDPTRVAAQVVSGIGFLGAGVILRDGMNIRGLTTAATLWCAAAVGSLAGSGMLAMALLGSAAIVATNTLLRPVSQLINRRAAGDTPPIAIGDETVLTEYVMEVVTNEQSEERVRALVLQAVDRPEWTLRSLDVRPGKGSRMRVLAGISSRIGDDTIGLQAAVRRIGLDPKVTSSKWWPAEVES